MKEIFFLLGGLALTGLFTLVGFDFSSVFMGIMFGFMLGLLYS